MTIRPDRALVERIIREEAEAANIPATRVLELARDTLAKMVRNRAMKRIARETGAGPKAISLVWGCSEPTVAAALGRPCLNAPPQPPRFGAYDGRTIERLTWAHGPERVAAIVAGQDAATQADLAAWRRVGADR